MSVFASGGNDLLDAPMNDLELIEQFLRTNSQTAFAALVERHINLVYSAALRISRDSHSAEDIVQQTFTLLAQKAHRFNNRTILPAWLYRTARNLALEKSRAERRRMQREQLASGAMNEPSPAPAWEEIEPLLDETMADLSATDHVAIVLRYFENKSLSEVASVIGASEDAAQKRIARALEHLRKAFARRGVTAPLAAITGAIAANSIRSAPGALGAAIAAASLSCAPTNSLPLLMKIFGSIQSKVTLAAALITLVAVSVTLMRIKQSRTPAQASPSVASSAETAVTNAINSSSAEELLRLRKEHLELLTLRGKVAALTVELRQLKEASNQPAATPTRPKGDEEDSILFSASLTNAVPISHTIFVGGWTKEKLRSYLLLTPCLTVTNSNPEPQITVKSQIISAPEKFWSDIGWASFKSDLHRSAVAGILNPDQTGLLLDSLQRTPESSLSNSSTSTVQNGGKSSFGWSQDDDRQASVLMMIDAYAQLTEKADTIILSLSPTPIPEGTQLQTPLENLAKSP